MDLYEARARRIYGGWEVTVAGAPSASFVHRDPNDEIAHEKLAAVLGRTDFRVRLTRDDVSLAPVQLPGTTTDRSSADAGSYTQAERLVLLAGLSSGRGTMWSRMPGTVERLAKRGLVNMLQHEQTNGLIEAIPLGLTDVGIDEARKIQESLPD